MAWKKTLLEKVFSQRDSGPGLPLARLEALKGLHSVTLTLTHCNSMMRKSAEENNDSKYFDVEKGEVVEMEPVLTPTPADEATFHDQIIAFSFCFAGMYHSAYSVHDGNQRGLFSGSLLLLFHRPQACRRRT